MKLIIHALYRLILDTIEFIGSCEKETLLKELKQAATGLSTSKEGAG